MNVTEVSCIWRRWKCSVFDSYLLNAVCYKHSDTGPVQQSHLNLAERTKLIAFQLVCFNYSAQTPCSVNCSVRIHLFIVLFHSSSRAANEALRLWKNVSLLLQLLKELSICCFRRQFAFSWNARLWDAKLSLSVNKMEQSTSYPKLH